MGEKQSTSNGQMERNGQPAYGTCNQSRANEVHESRDPAVDYLGGQGVAATEESQIRQKDH